MIGDVLWAPGPDARAASRLGPFADRAEVVAGCAFDDYAALWRWSIGDLDGFWALVWEHFDVRASVAPTAVLATRAMPGAVWFPGARLNYAEHALRHRGPDAAVVARSQTRGPSELSRDDLAAAVARARAGLVRLGVGPGDRVAAYAPNIPETLIAFLATASLGATWSSCAPEFGVQAVVDRFGQIEPVLLLVVDGYRYGARAVDRRAEVAALRRALPSVRTTVAIPYLDPDGPPPDGAASWSDLCAHDGPLAFEQVPFDHPLYVLYSSGTTGLPKPIVHGHGGILLEHLKALGLQGDLGPGDRFAWFTTTGWMMWNYLVSGLLVGAAVVLFDGDPGHPDLDVLWALAEAAGVTFLGVSAPFIHTCAGAGLRPGAAHDLSRLRTLGSTGAPLAPAGFRWVYDAVGHDLVLSPISGGTDVCTAFVGSAPTVPVWEGEISCPHLGVAVAAYDPEGRPLVGETGELVITEPMPSMPVAFWGDTDGSRLRAAYFEDFPGVWRHGDWITVTERGSCTITGRSDATLNRGGVRVGTAEVYRVVEAMDEVADSMVVHLEDPGTTGDGGGAGRLVLFVQTAPGVELDDDLVARLRAAVRTGLSPRHVPDLVVAVPGIPTTLSGKKTELPVKRILAGADPERAVSRDSLRDPLALDGLLAAARAAF